MNRKSAVSINKSNYTQVPESPRKRRIAKVVVGGGVALTAIVVTYMVTLGVVGLVSFVPQPTVVEISSPMSSAMASPISSIRDRLGVNASSLITPFNAKIVDAMASELVTSIGNGNARPSSFPIVDTITPFNKKISTFTIGFHHTNVSNVSTAAEIQSSLRGARSAKPAKPAKPVATLRVFSFCHGDFFDRIAKTSFSNKRLWCRANRVKCHINDRHAVVGKNDNLKWNKLHYILEGWPEDNSGWILWLDCDTLFTNFTIDWKTRIPGYPTSACDMVITNDHNGVNLGVFFIKATPRNRAFVQRWYDERHSIASTASIQDQTIFKRIRGKGGVRICELPLNSQRTMNAFIGSSSRGVGMWKKGDWIAHRVWCRTQPYCDDLFLKHNAVVTCQHTVIHGPTAQFCVLSSKWAGEFMKRVRGRGWEPKTRSLLNHQMALDKPEYFFEAGVHVGDHLLPLAMAFPFTKFVGVDPDATKCEFVRNMAIANNIDNVVVIHGALDSHEHVCDLDTSNANSGAWSVVRSREAHEARDKVQCYTIDNLLAKYGNKIGFIHLDLEGFEYQALKGAVRVLNLSKPNVLFENDHVRNKEGLYAFLRSQHYSRSGSPIEHNELWLP